MASRPGSRFAAPFEAHGVEDISDLADMPQPLLQQVLAELMNACGAKELQQNFDTLMQAK